eukprot:4865385-Prymnesium_polylepis.1
MEDLLICARDTGHCTAEQRTRACGLAEKESIRQHDAIKGDDTIHHGKGAVSEQRRVESVAFCDHRCRDALRPQGSGSRAASDRANSNPNSLSNTHIERLLQIRAARIAHGEVMRRRERDCRVGLDGEHRVDRLGLRFGEREERNRIGGERSVGRGGEN